jgi:hypothetical protein
MERRSARNLTINTTGGCRANPRICAVKKSATNFCEGICDEAMGNFKVGTTCAAVRGCGSKLPTCELPPHGQYLTIRFR